MRNSTFLKALFSLFLGVTILSAFAQAPTNHGDLTKNDGKTDYVTVGKTMPYLVHPDPYYNPNWTFSATDFTSATNYSNTWEWTLNTNTTFTGATLNQQSGSNYVKIAWDTKGDYVLGVTEKNAKTGLNCDGSEVKINVKVISEPSIDKVSTDQSWCDGGTAPTSVEFTITEENLNEATGQGFTFAYNYQVDNVDGAGTVLANVTPAAKTTITDIHESNAQLTNNGDGTYTFVITPGALSVENSKPTKYMWTLDKTDGINSQISRKSDYLTGTAVKHTIGDVVVQYTVFPAPTTGPIYHIPNDHNL